MILKLNLLNFFKCLESTTTNYSFIDYKYSEKNKVASKNEKVLNLKTENIN